MSRTDLTPTIFDKIASTTEVAGARLDSLEPQRMRLDRQVFRFHSQRDIERYSENAVRATVQRELAWLLNTTNLEATFDLTPYKEVRTSVLNYGIAPMTGRITSDKDPARGEKESRIREAILAFEPRIAADTLRVQNRRVPGETQVTRFEIHGDITAASGAVSVHYLSDFEVLSGEAGVEN